MLSVNIYLTYIYHVKSRIIVMKAPLYTIQLPSLQNVDHTKIGRALTQDPRKVSSFTQSFNTPEYLSWDKVKYKYQSDFDHFSAEEIWTLLKIKRVAAAKVSPVISEQGAFFSWVNFEKMNYYLHRIDMSVGGQILTAYKDITDVDKKKFISRGVIEEAIASSQLEGAHTTRDVAKKMILDQRKPRTKSERMIMNNFQTIQYIDEQCKDRDLTLDLLFSIHASLVEGTDSSDCIYRLRKDSDDIVVQGMIASQEYTTHIPPQENFLKEQLNELFNFVNTKDSMDFVHPVIRAIILHFWIGYLHPFCDGNGRLARALFYWYLLKQGYWGFSYLPISRIIQKSPVQYAKAYIYSEQDGYDLTYFLQYNLQKIDQSVNEFNKYLEETLRTNKSLNIKFSSELNERQQHILHSLYHSQNKMFTIREVVNTFQVTRQTASQDLHNLVKKNILKVIQQGRNKYFALSEE